jgi:integrase
MTKRSIHKLTTRFVVTAKPGRHGDGGGLYLVVARPGAGKWVFRFTLSGAMHDMGLGSSRDVPLARAREKAAAARALLADGSDPLAFRRAERRIPTFGELADELIESMKPTWKNKKHEDQWVMTLRDYAASLRPMTVDKPTTDDVLNVLRPIWHEKPETASRLRGRIERVFDAARARGFRQAENPARWRGHLNTILPARNKLGRKHHKAMPFEDIPALFTRLRLTPTVSNLALEFTILTAARSGETRLLKPDEIDKNAKVWTVPADRMKEGREHRVPLTDRVLEIIEEMDRHNAGAAYLFPGREHNKPLSDMALAMALYRLDDAGHTVHGFRSSFRDWVGDVTHFPREIAEAALSHAVGDETEQAYRRGDALAKRREMMDAWAQFCAGYDNKVVRLVG